jgi:DNA-binding TFAR19-related protein (PDSD5 family)
MRLDANKRFYIYDPQKDLLKRSEKVQVKKEADKEFIKVSMEESKMQMLLRVLTGGDPDRLSKIEIENTLYDYKEKNPERFLKYSLDTNLEVRFEIEDMIAKSILRKIGNQVIYEDETIGEDMKDTITYFKNKKNSGIVNILRAKLKEVS